MRTILQGGLLDHRPGSGSFSDSGDAPSQGDREGPQARCIRAEVQGAHHPASPTHLGPIMILPDSARLPLLCRHLGSGRGVDCQERQSRTTSRLLHGQLRMRLGLEHLLTES